MVRMPRLFRAFTEDLPAMNSSPIGRGHIFCGISSGNRGVFYPAFQNLMPFCQKFIGRNTDIYGKAKAAVDFVLDVSWQRRKVTDSDGKSR